MTAQRKAEIARINGSKSRGPRTLAGKQRSVRNATSHGIYSSQLILPGESQSEYDALHADLLHRFQPGTSAQHQLVEEMTRAKWLTLRLQKFEAAGLRSRNQSVKALRAWNTVSRAEARYQRQFDRALLALEAAQKFEIEPTPPPQKPQSEPKSIEKRGIEPTFFAIVAKLIRKPIAAILHLCFTNFIRT